MQTLHVHLDESGDFNFSPRGTRFFVFTVAWTYDPLPLANDLTALRFNLLKQSLDLHRFHATSDRQAVRDQVVATMSSHRNWLFVSTVVEKAKVNPSIREQTQFYPKFAAMVLRFVLKGCVKPTTDQIVIFTDELPVQHQRKAVQKAIHTACRDALPAGMRFDAFHHPCASNKWLQVADYCCWSVHRKWERGDTRTYDQIRTRLYKTELDVLSNGTHRYY